MDIGAWLKELGLGQYASAFADNDIDFAVLAQLTDADLKELGVSSFGHRKRLLAEIAEKHYGPVGGRCRPVRMASAGKSLFFSPISAASPHCRNRWIPEEVRDLVAVTQRWLTTSSSVMGARSTSISATLRWRSWRASGARR